MLRIPTEVALKALEKRLSKVEAEWLTLLAEKQRLEVSP